ncbi:cysteine-rich protein [Hydrogenispora ethanolica]|uniref:Cysteine-rich protein n=1 Tax=Hydrogenispora ethanolica TaxID=1082276 RepID=A0A4R1RAB0_HYDET|nr:(Fe-S)-binding protein [Hydrogenispora ethanolica]TCL62332.1 cysteine-rich protein [Hydrogenispora ethanolica]
MNQVYAPGCAVMIYKPELAQKMLAFFQRESGAIPVHLTCCRHEPKLPAGTRVINTCAGCDRRYRELYDGVSTISLWEILAESESFPFPDYHGQTMAIHDACPTRGEERVHRAVRKLLEKMKITVLEPENTRDRATCCGDSFYGALPVEQVKEQMKKRAREMPAEDVAVYCLSCVKAMHIGGKKTHYLLDLLWNEATTPGTSEPEAWHGELQRFIAEH